MLSAIEERLEANRRCPKDFEFTLRQILDHLNARLLKPQRLVSLSYEEEERRRLRTWWRFDEKLHLACFKPLEELAEWVTDPEKSREHVRELIIWMNDQIPMWLNIKPGSRSSLSLSLKQDKLREI